MFTRKQTALCLAVLAGILTGPARLLSVANIDWPDGPWSQVSSQDSDKGSNNGSDNSSNSK